MDNDNLLTLYLALRLKPYNNPYPVKRYTREERNLIISRAVFNGEISESDGQYFLQGITEGPELGVLPFSF